MKVSGLYEENHTPLKNRLLRSLGRTIIPNVEMTSGFFPAAHFRALGTRQRTPGDVLGGFFPNPGIQFRVSKKVGKRPIQACANLGQGGEAGVVFAGDDFAQGGLGDVILVGIKLDARIPTPQDLGPDPFANVLKQVQFRNPSIFTKSRVFIYSVVRYGEQVAGLRSGLDRMGLRGASRPMGRLT